MAPVDKRKQTVYFPRELYEAIHDQSIRMNVSFSWILQKAWKIAENEIKRLEPHPPLENAVVKVNGDPSNE